MRRADPQSRARAALRRTRVTLAGGGLPSYPAFVRADRPPKRRGGVRPYFTRRTVARILHDVIAAERENYADLVSEERPTTVARWSGDRLTLEESGYWPTQVHRRTLRPMYGGLYALSTPSLDWVEESPRWPRRVGNAATVLRLLDASSLDARPLVHRLRREVATPILLEALAAGGDDARARLVSIIGERDDAEARRAVAACLRDRSAGVRAEAAHVLEHHPDDRWGPDLLAAAMDEGDPDVLVLQIRAIGASRYQPACSWLKHLVDDPDLDLGARATAAAVITQICRGDVPEGG